MTSAEFIVHAPTCLWRWNRQCSETSTYKFQTPGNHPKESIEHMLVLLVWGYDENWTEQTSNYVVYRLVTLAKVYSRLRSLNFCSSINIQSGSKGGPKVGIEYFFTGIVNGGNTILYTVYLLLAHLVSCWKTPWRWRGLIGKCKSTYVIQGVTGGKDQTTGGCSLC